jgi:dimethylhistidine N-methyltransferase
MKSPAEAVAFVDLEPELDSILHAVLMGLARQPKSLPCKLFYDARGARLFETICTLPEYYPTRTELAILRANGQAIAGALGPAATIVEFGSGSGEKTRALLDALERPAAYVAIDIARDAVLASTRAIARERPDLEAIAVCADYGAPLALPALAAGRRSRRVGLFLGSTIGNFAPGEAVAFLANARNLLGPGAAMIVGADLRKERALLEAAYNDSRGVTAEFNMNVLRRINRELGGTFDLGAFEHRAFFDDRLSRIEMHLASLKDQEALVARQRFRFAAGDTIHTENSHKYTLEDFGELARAAGFVPRAHWVDRARLFSLHYLEV